MQRTYTSGNIATARNLSKLTAEIAKMEKIKKACIADLKKLLGDDVEMDIGGEFTAKWRFSQRKSVDLEKMLEDGIDISKYEITKESKAFLFK